MSNPMPDMLLPVTVRELPIRFAFQPDGQVRDKVARAIKIGVVKIVAGPEKCHAVIDVKRPYFRPAGLIENIAI